MNRYALVVGISQYQSRSLPALSKPNLSAEAVAKLLETHGNFQEVRRLPAHWLSADRAEVGRSLLTEAELSAEIKQLLNEQAIGGEVLIYFSGHGFVVSDSLGGSEAYLAASDTQIGVADGQVVWQQNGIRLRSLAEQFVQAKFSSLVMLLDCCHSGSLIESGVVQQALTNASSRDYVLIAACRGFEKAYEGEAEAPYSNFTSALLAGLERRRAGDTGQISSDRLFDHLSQALKGTGQEPIRLGLGRSIAIVTYPPSEAIPAETRFNPANPYVGLAAFESFQADYFFGRDGEIRSLLERLDPLQKPTRRFLAVIGPSGSGKSSLVKAGLAPALAKDALPGSSQWQIEPLKPGTYPLAALNAAIAKYTDAQPHLLLIDQFEELFTLCQSEEEQRAFLALLNQQVTRPDRQARVVITMRADFLDRCARYQESADLINQLQPTTFMVTPLTDDKLAAQLGQAIVQPATQHGVEFQPGLAAQMSSDVRNQLGALPLLQFALTELWKHCIPDGAAEPCLTWAGYEAIGGVGGALQRRADSLYASLTESDRDLLKKLVMELVQIGDGGEVSRRRAERQELWALAPREQVDRLLDRLTAERFLMVDGETVEVAHEALLSEAPRIRAWIEENRENLRLRDRFERDCREWQEQERSNFYLLNPGKLSAVEEWVANTNPVLSTVESEFVGESVGKRDADFKAKIRIAKIAMNSSITAAILLVLTQGLVFHVQQQRSQLEQQQALSRQNLLGKVQQSLETHNELQALISSVEAVSQFKRMDQESDEKLGDLISQIRERNRFPAHKSQVTGVNFSPNGKLVASSSYDQTIRVINIKNNQLSSPVSAHKKLVRRVRFSRNGQRLASVSDDQTIKLWNVNSLDKPIKSFNFGDEVPYSVSFNSSDERIAVSGIGSVVRVWNIQNREFSDSSIDLFTPVQNGTKNYRVQGLDFHPQKPSILATTGFKDHDLFLWDLAQKPINGKLLSKPVGQTKSITASVKFDQTGKMLVSCGGDIKIWSSDGNLIGKISTGENPAFYAEFSPDSKLVASVHPNNTINFWDVSKAIAAWKLSPSQTISQPTDKIELNTGIVEISFRPRKNFTLDQELVSTGDDGTIRIWRVSGGSFPKSEDEYKLSYLFEKGCKILRGYREQNSKSFQRALEICKENL